MVLLTTLVALGDAWQIEDLGSSNGTYVNGVRVRGPVVVRPGDRIGLGSYTFTLNLSGDLEQSDDFAFVANGRCGNGSDFQVAADFGVNPGVRLAIVTAQGFGNYSFRASVPARVISSTSSAPAASASHSRPIQSLSKRRLPPRPPRS